MTILADTIVDIAGGIAVNQIYIAAKQTHDQDGKVVFASIHTVPVVAGAFTTPDLEDGPAVVTIGTESYDIVLSGGIGTVVRLGPLITPPEPDGWYKDPSDIAPYKFDWSGQAPDGTRFLGTGETITSQTVTVALGLTLVGTASITDLGTSVTFKVSGGTTGSRVKVGCLITSSGGNTFETEKYITVRERTS